MNFGIVVVILLVLFCCSGTAVLGYLMYDLLSNRKPGSSDSHEIDTAVGGNASADKNTVDTSTVPKQSVGISVNPQEGMASRPESIPGIYVKIANSSMTDNAVFETLSRRYAGVDNVKSCQDKCDAAGAECIGFMHDRVNTLCSIVQPGDGNPNDSVHIRLPDSSYVHMTGTGLYDINTNATLTVENMDTLDQCLAVCNAAQSTICSGVYYNETYNVLASPMVKVRTCKQFRFAPSPTTDIYIKKRQ